MACPRVADGGTASNMEGSREYIESTVADSREWGGTPAWGLDEALTTPIRKNVSHYEIFTQKTCECGNETSGSIKCGEIS